MSILRQYSKEPLKYSSSFFFVVTPNKLPNCHTILKVLINVIFYVWAFPVHHFALVVDTLSDLASSISVILTAVYSTCDK